MNTSEAETGSCFQEVADLIDADFSLHVLQALLDDGDEGSRRHQGSIDVGLTDVALYTEGEG